MTRLAVDTSADLPGGGELAATFVDLARAVTEGADMVEVFSMLSARCVRFLPAAACGILVVDPNGALQVIGASSSSAHLLDLFQVQNAQGPCLQCCRTGQPVADTELAANGPWPSFAAAARAQGFSVVYALPLAARSVVIGALNLFALAPLGREHLVVAQALADAATIALLQADPREDLVVLTRQLHLAVETRNTAEQAKGMIAQRFGIDADAALTELRLAAERSGSRVCDVAAAVVRRDLDSPLARLLQQRLA